MKKLYEALDVDVVKFEAQDVITVSLPDKEQNPDGDQGEVIPPNEPQM